MKINNLKMKVRKSLLPAIFLLLAAGSCHDSGRRQFIGAKGEIVLMTLDPGHFHAALVQKQMYEQVNPKVYVYAPEGDELNEHIARINAYNTRTENATSWEETVCCSDDFLERMLDEKKGNVMITAGNNRKKTEYIKQAVDAGINVLSDKPMAIHTENFELLCQAFASAQRNGVLLYDIMPERFEITTILQREFSLLPDVFGILKDGDTQNPSIIQENVHHFAKFVSDVALKRPAWFFDVEQQGEGLTDVATHLVDLVQWECFPGKIIDYRKDIRIFTARRWTTGISKEEFGQVTSLTDYPAYLEKDVRNDSLFVYANGEINYSLRGKHARVTVKWRHKSPDGAGDTHYSVMHGTKASLVIRQEAEQDYKPVLYIEPVTGDEKYNALLQRHFKAVEAKYQDISLKKTDKGWKIVIPEKYNNGHEAHFGQVTEHYLRYLSGGKLPDWEIPGMIAKYYTTTKALEMAKQNR